VLFPLSPPRAGSINVDQYVATEMALQHIPGLSYAIVRDGAVVTSGARGLANVELAAPATEVTEFAIASVSKSLTASAVLLLEQDGALSVDDSVSKYLAGLPDTWKTMTIRHLLSHTAGVKDHFRDFPKYPPILDRRLAYTEDEYLKAHIDAPLNFAPGAEWAYSGGGYVVLGAVIAKASGRPYREFMQDRVFRPLGMEHTHVISLADVISNRASGYWFREGSLRNGGYTGQAHISGPDVAVMTTATDLAKWLIAVSTPRLWTPASRDAMWTRTTLADGRDAVRFPIGGGYGLGFGVGNYRRYRMIGHGGSLVNGFMSALLFIPEKHVGVVVLTNQYDSSPQRIALGLLGRIDTDLTPPHEVAMQRDADPAASTRGEVFITALFSGGDLSSLATPGLVKHLSAMSRPPTPPNPTAPSVGFIATEVLAPPMTRYGASVVRLATYTINDQGEEHWITLYLTADGKVADVAGY
jgi:CubicO group peptidase (beta-lactamase class C family)